MKPKGSQFIQLPMFMRAGDLADGTKVGHADQYAYQGFGSYSPNEHMARSKVGESLKPGTSDDTWQRRGSGQSLRESIAEKGVKNPVEMTVDVDNFPHGPEIPKGDEYRLQVFDGHHRVFAAADVNPDMEVPLNYHFPDIDTTWRGPLGDTPKWNDLTRNPGQESAWGPDPRPERD